MNIRLPDHVYHYTTPPKFRAIIQSETMRLHTVDNFQDKLERKCSFAIEESVKGVFTDNATGATVATGLSGSLFQRDHRDPGTSLA
jgi:hypothetical protein